MKLESVEVLRDRYLAVDLERAQRVLVGGL